MKLTHENTHFIPTLLILLYCVFNVDVVLIVRIAQKLHIFLYIFLFSVAFLETHALTVARRTCNALTFLTKLDDLIFFFKIKIHEKGMIGR